jgi:hypothetical protein
VAHGALGPPATVTTHRVLAVAQPVAVHQRARWGKEAVDETHLGSVAMMGCRREAGAVAFGDGGRRVAVVDGVMVSLQLC